MGQPAYESGANLQVRRCLNALTRSLGYEAFNKKKHFEGVLDFFDRECAYCGVKNNLEVDHIIGLNKDDVGLDCVGNIVPACKRCNNKKKSISDFVSNKRIKRINEWMRQNDYLHEHFEKDSQAVKSVSKKLNAMYKEVVSKWKNLSVELLREVHNNTSLELEKGKTPISFYAKVDQVKSRDTERKTEVSCKSQFSKRHPNGSWIIDMASIKLEQYNELSFILKDYDESELYRVKLPTQLIRKLISEERIHENDRKQNIRLNFIKETSTLYLEDENINRYTMPILT